MIYTETQLNKKIQDLKAKGVSDAYISKRLQQDVGSGRIQIKRESEAPVAEGIANKVPLVGKLIGGVVRPLESGLRLAGGLAAQNALALGTGSKNRTIRRFSEDTLNRGDIPLLSSRQEELIKQAQSGGDVRPLFGEALRKSAGLASYLVPGAKGMKAVRQGTVRGGLLGASQDESGIEDIVGGAVTGGAVEGTLSNIGPISRYAKDKLKGVKLPKSMGGGKLAKFGEGLETSGYIKRFGKPKIEEGGVPAFKAFKDTGIRLDSVETMGDDAMNVLKSEGPKLGKAASDLSAKGVTIPRSDLETFLNNKINSKITSEAKAPYKVLLDRVKGDFPKRIDPNNFYRGKMEIGEAGKWNPIAPAAEKTLAKANEELYMHMNSIFDSTLKNNGFKDMQAINKAVSTALKAKHFAERRGLQIGPTDPATFGDVVSGGLGATAFGGPGAVGGYALNRAIKSPTTRIATGKMLQNGPKVNLPQMPRVQIPPKYGQLASKYGPRLTVAGIMGQPNIPQEAMSEDLGTDFQGGVGDFNPQEELASGQLSPRFFQELAKFDLQTTGGKNMAKIEAMYKSMEDMGAFSTGSKKPTSVAGANQYNLASSGLRSLQDVKRIIAEDPTVLTRQLTPGQFFSREYDAAAFSAVEALLRMRSGAAVPESEVRRYMRKIMPVFGDNKATIDTKLLRLEQNYNDVLNSDMSQQTFIQQ